MIDDYIGEILDFIALLGLPEEDYILEKYSYDEIIHLHNELKQQVIQLSS